MTASPREPLGEHRDRGGEAEGGDHHPELRWAHREVELRLVTRDAGGAVTALDVELMRAIAALP